MAIIDYNFMSQSLMHPTTVKLVMPCNNKPEYVMIFLHGVLSDANNCVRNMDVQGMADRYKVAFIIPSCGNSFYIDHGVAFGNYGKFVGSELLERMRKQFSLPMDREHTIIAGFSMGGYGAIRNGAKYCDTFGTVIGLSSACLYEKSVNELNKGKFGYYKLQMFDKVFKEKSVPGNFSENYKYVIEEKLKKGKKLPFFYISCGREEELRQINTEFVNYLKELHVKCYYNLSHGEHNWQLWSREIDKALMYVTGGEGENSFVGKGV